MRAPISPSHPLVTSSTFVVACLASQDMPWAQVLWAASDERAAAIGTPPPLEVLRCGSTAELLAVLAAGTALSCAVLDAWAPGIDRELLARICAHPASSIVVDRARARAPWTDLGATAVVDRQAEPADLVLAICSRSRPVPVPATAITAATASPQAPTVVVVGSPGADATTIARAVAQGLSTSAAHRPLVLVDAARRGRLRAILRAADGAVGLQEFIAAHRTTTPGQAEILLHTVPSPGRDHRVLLGLRHHLDWVALGARSSCAAIDTLRRGTAMVVAIIDGDLEGEAETGSVDLEDRHHLARTLVQVADVVVVVAPASPFGRAQVAALHRDVARLRPDGVPMVVAFEHPDQSGSVDADAVAGPAAEVHLAATSEAVRAGGRLPLSLVEPVARAVRDRLSAQRPRRPAALDLDQGTLVAPGDLGQRDDPRWRTAQLGAPPGAGWITPRVPQQP